MQSQLISLLNPRWADSEHTMIDCEITTSQFGEEVLPFTASVDDVELHGRLVFKDIVDGLYGPIAEYVDLLPKPTPPSGEIPVEIL